MSYSFYACDPEVATEEQILNMSSGRFAAIAGLVGIELGQDKEWSGEIDATDLIIKMGELTDEQFNRYRLELGYLDHIAKMAEQNGCKVVYC